MKNAPQPTAPNQLWISDVPYRPAHQRTVCLRLFTDACSRRIVGHHVYASRHTTGCLAALAQAVYGAGAVAGGVHHSNRGSPYASDAYEAALQQASLRCSMTDGYDWLPERAGRTR